MIIRLKITKAKNEYRKFYGGPNAGFWVGKKDLSSKCFPSERIKNIESVSSKRTKITVDDELFGYNLYDTYIVKASISETIKIINGSESWQDKENTFIEVERVYATRIDCLAVPEGVRRKTEGVQCKVIKNRVGLNTF